MAVIYPIGIQNFESLRKDGYLYIDKTAFVHELATTGRYYFLSRPFEMDGRKLVKIGVNFDSRTRSMDK